MSDPDLANRLYQAAREANRPQSFEMAEDLCLQVLALDPDHLGAKELLGLVASQTGRLDMAIFWTRQLVASQETWPNLHSLAMMLRQNGEPEAAIAVRTRANELRPDDIHGIFDLGATFNEARRFEDALETFKKLIAIEPSHSGAMIAAGESAYRMGRFQEARAYWTKAYQAKPESAEGHFYMAQALAIDGDTAKAIGFIRSAIARRSNNVPYHQMLGDLLQRLGRFEEATASFERALDILPFWGPAYASLVRGRKMVESDRPLVKRMLEALSHPWVRDPNRLELHYALGKALDDLGEYEEAMRHFDEGNRLARSLEGPRKPFDQEVCAKQVDEMIATYTRESFSEHRSIGSESELPVLIVGMMRSGTTLVEQILSSHPQIGGAGEQTFWLERSNELHGNLGPDFDFSKLALWANEYLGILKSLGEDKQRIVDKNPHNFSAIGLIHSALPHARIIHCRRHPVDTCLSIYVTRNESGADFMYSRENITFMYEQYMRLMEHWASVLPPDRYIEVSYEDVVQDREPVIRKVIEFCGLPWDDACLHHEKNERTVMTPSMWQARQSVYTTSVGRWRNYEPWLGEFRRLLSY